MGFFLSYNFDDEPFVQLVNYFLLKQPDTYSYCYAEDKRAGMWETQLTKALADKSTFVFFLGQQCGEVQLLELAAAHQGKKAKLLVTLPGSADPPSVTLLLTGLDSIVVNDFNAIEAGHCAHAIVNRSGLTWVPDDGLPIGYPFSSEREIIDEYLAGAGKLRGKRIEEGCPSEWPLVEKYTRPNLEDLETNPISEEIIGDYRKEDAGVIADTRATYFCDGWSDTEIDSVRGRLTFPEAGPREKLLFPEFSTLSIGILVSGGIAPGINAVVDGIVSRHRLYAGDRYALNIRGYREGFRPLIKGFHLSPLDLRNLRGNAESAGSLLGTSRADELLDGDSRIKRRALNDIVRRLRSDQIDILYVIGGDGSMRAAHAIWKAANPRSYPERSNDESVTSGGDRRLSVVAVPKTMDNDILWVWQAFGFLSAVEKARETILSLHTETTSNPRLGIVQLFGSDSGFVASHAALASGVCDLVLIPEVHFSMAAISDYIRGRLAHRLAFEADRGSPHSLIVMAETAIPVDALSYVEDEDVYLNKNEKKALVTFLDSGMRVSGQTPDDLRSAGLKIVSRVLQRDINNMPNPYWRSFRVVTNEPRHLIRSVAPSVSDVIFGERLGALAVDNAMAGYTDFMVSQWKTEFVLVPLRLVVLGRKRVPEGGIFWKSVRASTGQPADLFNMPLPLKRFNASQKLPKMS